jgi:hypothetical protein
VTGSENPENQEVAVDDVGTVVDGPVQPTAAVGADDHGGGESLDDLFVDWVIEHCSIVEYVWSEKRAAWCPEWWKHPEAVERLFALWTARTQAYANDEDLAAVSSWWAYHWDHHAPILFDTRTGPFRNCDKALGHLHDDGGTRTPVVEAVRPPIGWARSAPTR